MSFRAAIIQRDVLKEHDRVRAVTQAGLHIKDNEYLSTNRSVGDMATDDTDLSGVLHSLLCGRGQVGAERPRGEVRELPTYLARYT